MVLLYHVCKLYYRNTQYILNVNIFYRYFDRFRFHPRTILSEQKWSCDYIMSCVPYNYVCITVSSFYSICTSLFICFYIWTTTSWVCFSNIYIGFSRYECFHYVFFSLYLGLGNTVKQVKHDNPSSQCEFDLIPAPASHHFYSHG